MKKTKIKIIVTIFTLVAVLMSTSMITFAANNRQYYGVVGKSTKYSRSATSTIQNENEGYYKLKVKLYYKTKNNLKKHTNPSGIKVVSVKKYNPLNPKKPSQVAGYLRIKAATFTSTWAKKDISKVSKGKHKGKYAVIVNTNWTWETEKPIHNTRTHYFK